MLDAAGVDHLAIIQSGFTPPEEQLDPLALEQGIENARLDASRLRQRDQLLDDGERLGGP